MNIVHVTTTDPAGSVYNMANAINQNTEHHARVITTHRIDAFDFPADVHWVFDGGDEISSLLEKADVIHLHKVDPTFKIEFDMPKAGIKRTFLIEDVLKNDKNKKVVFHIHGHPYERANVKENAENYAKWNAKILTSTPDLEQMYLEFNKNVSYFPNCVPINNMLYIPRATDRPIIGADGVERYVIVQTPTNMLLKNVHVIENAVNEAKKLVSVPIAYLRVWEQTLDFAMRQKRNAHVVFDHIEGYYGMSSLEGLSLGKPTIAGLSAYTIEAICKFFGIIGMELPWVVARDQAVITECLIKLFSSTEFRNEVGAKSRKFMEEVWSDRIIGQRLAAFYTAL